MRPLYVTVHSSTSPVFGEDGAYYPFSLFEQISSLAAQEPTKKTNLIELSLHCTNNLDIYICMGLENNHLMSFQCFWAEFMHQYMTLLTPEQQEECADAYTTIKDFKWVLH